MKSINAISGVQGVAAGSLTNRAQKRAIIAATYNHRNQVNSTAMSPQMAAGMI